MPATMDSQWQTGRRGRFDRFMDFITFMSSIHNDDFGTSTEWDGWSETSDTRARADSPGSDTDTLALSQMSLPFDTPRASDIDSSTAEEGWSSPEVERPWSPAVSNASSLSTAVQELMSEEEWSLGEEHIEYEPAPDEETSRSDGESAETVLDVDGGVTSNVETQHGVAVDDNCPVSPARLAVKRPASDVDLEAACCSICLDVWAGGGRHRVVALECGHVFGESCIRRWLRRGASPRCPTCKIYASVESLRRLRPALVSSPDVSSLREALTAARAESRRVRFDLARAVSDQEEMSGEVEKLKEQMKPAGLQQSTVDESPASS